MKIRLPLELISSEGNCRKYFPNNNECVKAVHRVFIIEMAAIHFDMSIHCDKL